MAYETGTATDSADLFSKLRTFLTSNTDLVTAGQEWTELAYTENGNDAELYLRGQGNGGSDQIYVGLRRFLYSSDSYNWEIMGAVNYDSGIGFSSQPNRSPAAYNYFHNTPMTYWFFANGRHFKAVVKVQSTYQHLYCGFILPYATPTEYAYPLFIGGCGTSSNKRFSDSDNTMAAYYRNYDRAFLMGHDGAWRTFRSLNVGYAPTNGINQYLIYPYCASTGVNNHSIPIIAESFGDGYPLFNVTLAYYANYPTPSSVPGEIYGVLDNCYYIPGIDNASESSHTLGADTYRAFQNVFRSGAQDFMAYKEE